MQISTALRSAKVAIALGASLLLAATPVSAQIVRQLTDVKTGVATVPALDDAGTDVFVASSTNQLGGNASHAFQVVRFTATTGAGTQLTSAVDGVANGPSVVSVSDDDQWVAFISNDNLTGQNADRSGEVFVMMRDGTALQQITNHPGAGTGEPLIVAMAGGGTKVAFTSTANLTGSNASHHEQVFLENKDGTGLAQVTALSGGDIDFLGISDDATKIVFASEANPFGTNADENLELFAINSDGTGLKQLTNTTDAGEAAPAVVWMSFAGGGSKVAFSGYADPLGTNADHGSEVFCVDYAGTNLKQLTNSTAPLGIQREADYAAITDDGVTVFFTSNAATMTQNPDGSFELWKVKTDGTGKTLLTNNGIEYAELVVSGSGNRVAFRDVADREIKVIDATGANLRSLTSTTKYTSEYASIDGAASLVAFSSTADLVPPGNSSHLSALYTIHPDGTGLAQIGGSLDVEFPVIAGNGGTIVFDSGSDPLGTNADHNDEIFRINANGTGLQQVTSSTGPVAIYFPAISRDGSVIVFTSNANYLGTNADANYEEWKINANGTGIVQLTNTTGSQTISLANALDDAGVWVTFESNANLDGAHGTGAFDVWRMKTDGTGLQAITSGGASDSSDYPDFSADGSKICFDSTMDLTGGNADRNSEIFLWQSGTYRQLTSAAEGDSYYCRFSGNGQWAYFASNEPLFEDNPSKAAQFYRVNIGTGEIERVDGLGFEPAYNSPAADYGDINLPVVDDSGDHAVWALSTNATRGNPDFFKEIFHFDRVTPAAIRVSSGPAPTRVSWDVESGPVRYDVVRGDLANVHVGPTTVDLGTVACVKNDSAVASTEGSDDGQIPAPGQAFFYVYRGSQGLSAGPGSYGSGTGGKERVASSGDCGP